MQIQNFANERDALKFIEKRNGRPKSHDRKGRFLYNSFRLVQATSGIDVVIEDTADIDSGHYIVYHLDGTEAICVTSGNESNSIKAFRRAHKSL